MQVESFQFFKSPIVYLISPFILGILLSDFASDWFVFIAGLQLIVLSLFLVKNRRIRQFQFYLFILLGTFTLGVLTHNVSNGGPNIDQEEVVEEDLSAIVSIEEIKKTSSIWYKAIGEIHFKIEGGHWVERNEEVLLYSSDSLMKVGDELLVSTTFHPITNKGNPGEFNVQSYWKGKGISRMAFLSDLDYRLIRHNQSSGYHEFTERIRSTIRNVLASGVDGQQFAVANALILGDKSYLSPETKRQFSSAGAMHVLAVSGLHIGILLEILLFVFGRFPRVISKRWAILFSLIILWGYGAVIGFPASVLRSILMFSIIVLAKGLGRESSSINALFTSAFVLLLFSPDWIFDIGFQLSYAAMLGIFTLYRPLSTVMYVPNKIMRKVWEGTAVCLSAQLFTFPLTLYYFHQFPNYFLLTNLGLMIIVGIILLMIIAYLATSWISVLSKILGMVLGGVLLLLLLLVDSVDQLPWAVAYGFDISSLEVVIIYSLLGVAVLLIQIRKYQIVLIPLGILLLLFVEYKRYANLKVNDNVLLNSNQLVLIVKRKNRMICLHDSPDEKIGKLTYLVDNYRSVYPGDIELIHIKNGLSTQFGKDQLSIERKEKGYTVKIGEKEYIIVTRIGADFDSEQCIVQMPYLPENEMTYSLKYGAIHLNESLCN